ncbi:MAG: hypothetical protein ACYST3_01960 [Planctomycetota bacterium]
MGLNISHIIKVNTHRIKLIPKRLQVELDGDVEAWRRRLSIVRFEGPVPEKKIPDFASVLIVQEGSGILTTMDKEECSEML